MVLKLSISIMLTKEKTRKRKTILAISMLTKENTRKINKTNCIFALSIMLTKEKTRKTKPI